MTRKKEKKKKSDEERKARNEKKRQLAEQSGTIPVELIRADSSSSASAVSGPVPTPRSSSSPTTDPLRIYRRCCQLRETPILKKITEQLALPSNTGDKPGVVARLDLTDCWLQLADLATLGDYLAVVPVKELIMENCGLTDEGVRIILAGLLAAPSSDNVPKPKRPPAGYQGPTTTIQRLGAVQRLTLKNNPKIGQDGWRYISLFINMSRSLRNLDVSMIPFPQTPMSPKPMASVPASPVVMPARSTQQSEGTPARPTPTGTPTPIAIATSNDPAAILSKAIATRLAGPELELLNLAETGVTATQIDLIVTGAIASGMKRLGLAGNNLTEEGMSHVSRYLRESRCEGLDLGGNELTAHLATITEALTPTHPLFALSLANCSLSPQSLATLFPALLRLKNFRFIDLSHNPLLFTSRPSAVSILRKYLPLLKNLKRIHLSNCALSPEQAIALAEIFPDAPGLAHVNLLGNPELTALASAGDSSNDAAAAEAHQEEACALYASLMAAVRVSRSLICIDIDLPAAGSSEVVKALAKQVVAYSLRNMERGPVAEITASASTSSVNTGSSAGTTNTSTSTGPEHEVPIPEVLAHLVGNQPVLDDEHTLDQDSDADTAFRSSDAQAPDEDYVIGGTGVVKALGICLKNRSADSSRRGSLEVRGPRVSLGGGVGAEVGDLPVQGRERGVSGAGKARDMSKNLLGSARRIRARLQPALVKEADGGGLNYREFRPCLTTSSNKLLLSMHHPRGVT